MSSRVKFMLVDKENSDVLMKINCYKEFYNKSKKLITEYARYYDDEVCDGDCCLVLYVDSVELYDWKY